MITDEQIMQIAKNYIRHVGSHYINELAIPDNGTIEGFARELIALAQQVKPLEWERNNDGGLEASSDGIYFYSIYDWVTPKGYVYDINGYVSELYDAEAEAIAAANEDYRKRVLSCLVNGGV